MQNYLVVTLSIEDDNELLDQLKTWFKEPLNETSTNQECLIRLKLSI